MVPMPRAPRKHQNSSVEANHVIQAMSELQNIAKRGKVESSDLPMPGLQKCSGKLIEAVQTLLQSSSPIQDKDVDYIPDISDVTTTGC
jgi:hypothetical protein